MLCAAPDCLDLLSSCLLLDAADGFCDECTTRLRAPPRIRRHRPNRAGSGDEPHHENLDNIATEPGRVVWQAANEMFEYLPLAARIGERILALHGGVGRTLNSIDQINALQRPLRIDHGINDEDEVSQGSQDPADGTVSPVLGSGALNKAKVDPLQHLLMDILWSDPSANDTVLGVAPNLVRGGATLTYLLRPITLLTTNPFCIGVLDCVECPPNFLFPGAGTVQIAFAASALRISWTY